MNRFCFLFFVVVVFFLLLLFFVFFLVVAFVAFDYCLEYAYMWFSLDVSLDW